MFTLCAAACVAVAGCGGSTASPASSNPRTLLSDAKAVLDRSPSVHFVLTSAGATGSGTIITGGSGDIARPDTMQGQFTVEQSGFSASIGILAKGAQFYAKLPFSSRYTATNPATYGVGNPAQLISPTSGLSSLLLVISQPRLGPTTRIGSEVVDQVEGTVPGSAVPVLPDANRSVPVAVTAAIVPSSHQLRRITLQGPFTSAAQSTYTVVLSNYGEAVHVTLPGG